MKTDGKQQTIRSEPPDNMDRFAQPFCTIIILFAKDFYVSLVEKDTV